MNTTFNGVITLPAWFVNFINFFKLMKFWVTQPITTYRVIFGKGWTPMFNIKNVEFMEQDGVTIFRHKNKPGEYRVAINEYTDTEMIYNHLMRIWR